MAKDYGDLHERTPAILGSINGESLAHALRQKRGNEQYSVFGTNVKRLFSGLTPEDEIKVFIRMNHTALLPGEEAVIDYMGTLDVVWLDPPAQQNNPEFFRLFEETFQGSWKEIKSGAGKWQEGPWPVYYGVRDIRYLRSPIRISELRNWSEGQYFVPNYRIRRPTRVIWEESFLDRLGA